MAESPVDHAPAALREIVNSQRGIGGQDFIRLQKEVEKGHWLSHIKPGNLNAEQLRNLVNLSLKNKQYHLFDWLNPFLPVPLSVKQKEYQDYADLCAMHPKIQGHYLCGLERFPQPKGRLRQYYQIADLLNDECEHVRSRNEYAYKAFLLFGSAEKFKTYVRRYWEKYVQRPHLKMITPIDFPETKNWDQRNFRAWGDMFLKFGPEAVKGLFTSASDYVRPLRSEKGDLSLSQTWAAFVQAACIQNLSDTHKEQLSNYVRKWKIRSKHLQEIFRCYAEQVRKPPAYTKSVPDIYIDGDEFGLPGFHFRKLDVNDLRIFFLGEFTNSCERINDSYENCRLTSQHAVTTRQSDFYIIADNETDHIAAHCWVWRGKNGEIIFDGFEKSKNAAIEPMHISDLLNIVLMRFRRSRGDTYGIKDMYIGRCHKTLDEVRKYYVPVYRVHAQPLANHHAGYNMTQKPELVHVGDAQPLPNFLLGRSIPEAHARL